MRFENLPTTLKLIKELEKEIKPKSSIIDGLTLEEMAKLLKTDKANLSRILNGHLEKTSLEKLYSYLSLVVIASKDKHLASLFNKKKE